MGYVTTLESRSEAVAESSITWADGALLAIDQRLLPGELRWLRITTVDELIDAIKTLAIRGAPALGVAGAFGVALAAYAHVGDTDTTTHDVEDTIIATKIRLTSESESRPAIGLRFATKLPNASNESGLGLNTTDFYMSLLGAKTVQSIRVVGNFGFGILPDPTNGNRQNDVLTYGLSFARAMTQQAEVVGELNGRVSTRSGDPFPGTESRGILKLGGRYTHASLRLDAAAYFGLTSVDPTIGFTAGFTYVFKAFTIP